MATNIIFKDAEYLSLPVPTGARRGSTVRVGVINAVLLTDEGSATATISAGGGVSVTVPSGGIGNAPGYASCALHGAVNAPVVAAAAVTVGQKIYIKPDNTLTDASSGNSAYGVALLPIAAAGTSTIPVKIIQFG